MIPSFLLSHPALCSAFHRFELLDANGASATLTDLKDALVNGQLSADDAERFAREITEACEALERAALE